MVPWFSRVDSTRGLHTVFSVDKARMWAGCVVNRSSLIDFPVAAVGCSHKRGDLLGLAVIALIAMRGNIYALARGSGGFTKPCTALEYITWDIVLIPMLSTSINI